MSSSAVQQALDAINALASEQDDTDIIGEFAGDQPAGARFNALYGQEARAERAAVERAGGVWQPKPQEIYYEGDERRIPSSFAVEDIATLQTQMARVGLLGKKFRMGVWDKPSRSAFYELLSYANQEGLEWGDALFQYAQGEARDRERVYTREAFLPADPETYREAVREMFQRTLKRDPTDAEFAEYEDRLRRADERSFDVEQDAAASQYDAQVQGLDEAPPLEGETQVNPMSRVEAFFNRKYRGAISDTADDAANEENAAASQGLSGSMRAVI